MLGFSVAILACLLASSLRTQSADPHDPAVEQASFRVADGYEVNLFASERDGVVKPIQLRFDPQGRLFVCGSVVYPQLTPGEKPDDKIILLEDENGDGRADKSTIFARNLFIPTGLEWGDGGVYVGQATELLHLQDRDGDGKADERRVVLSGFGTGDSHQTINSFAWGHGGELMMCQGLHALSRVETPWGLEQLHSAGVWRLRPKTLRLDAFLQREMGPQNPFGITFDKWGQPIMLGGNGQGLYYLTPAMIRAEHHRTLRALWNTGRKFGGADFVENSHFPPEAQGQLVTGSYLNNAVYRFKISERGAGFEVTELPPLITSTNTAFRIVDARFGPDGALYLCDWYNSVIGHYQASFRHPDRDRAHGRIWRVTAKGRPLVQRPLRADLPVSKVIDQLESSERWYRQMAKRILLERPVGEVTNALATWVESRRTKGAQAEPGLFEALGVYESMGVVESDLLQRLLTASNYHIRAYATRVIGHWQGSLENPGALLQTQVADPHPRVRLEAVVAASYLPQARAVEIATKVVEQPVDSFIEYALVQAIHTLKPYWRDAFLEHELTFDGHEPRLEFFVAADGSADTLGVIVERLRSPALSGEMRRSFLRILAETGGPNELGLLLEPGIFTFDGTYDANLQALALSDLLNVAALRKVRPSEPGFRALTLLVAGQEPQVRAAALRLAGIWKLASSKEQAEKMASDPMQPDSVRAAAVEAWAALDGPGSEPTLLKLAGSSAQSETVRSAAIQALASVNLQRAAEMAALVFSETKDEKTIESLFHALMTRRNGAGFLARELKTRPPSRRAAEIGLRLSGESGRRDSELAGVLMALVGNSGEVASLTVNDVGGMVTAVNTQGNALRGEEIYRRAQLSCAACHAINGQGGDLGPDLGALGTAQTAEFIVGAILWPNQEVKEGFASTEVLMKDGQEFQGYLLRENGEEVVLRDPLQKREVRLRRDTIRELKGHGSIMPAGLVDSLSRTELRDLVRYLSELGKQR